MKESQLILSENLLDVENDENYTNEVHCITYSFLGISGWHKSKEQIVNDMANGKVEMCENALNHNLHIVTDTEDYYAKTKNVN